MTEPRPRNPALADALKRIGLVERTGRGVDLIYRGLLRYGRHVPDFSLSSLHSVVLSLSLAVADEPFLKVILEEEARRAKELPVDSLIVLAALREQRRASTEQLATFVQKEPARITGTIEALVEAGLLQAHGAGRGRTYTLSPNLYGLLGEQTEYIQQAGFDRLQQEQLILGFIAQNGSITRKDVMRLCRLTTSQAYKLTKQLCEDGILEKQGFRKDSSYRKR